MTFLRLLLHDNDVGGRFDGPLQTFVVPLTLVIGGDVVGDDGIVDSIVVAFLGD